VIMSGIVTARQPIIRLAGQRQTLDIVRTGLGAEYRFDEDAGQILHDYSGNGNHLYLGSTPLPDVNDPAWVTQGLSFNGTVTYPLSTSAVPPQLANNPSATLLAIFYQKVPLSRNYPTLVYVGGWSSGGFSFSSPSTSGATSIIYGCAMANYSGWSVADVASLGVIPNNTFIMTTATFDTAHIFTYLNKKQIGQYSLPAGVYYPPTTGITIGCSFYGYISYACVYNRALSASEVAQNYNALKAKLAPRGVILS